MQNLFNLYVEVCSYVVYAQGDRHHSWSVHLVAMTVALTSCVGHWFVYALH